jgi:NAD(P)-dependent dehydrogenase (short-subunit alcohol dehydrogenase family)
MSPTVYLVSGANRGIGERSIIDTAGLELMIADEGLGLVTALAARANTVIFAGARNPSSASELRELAYKRENVHILELVSCDEAGNRAAVDEIKRIAGALHVVIANAGECGCEPA